MIMYFLVIFFGYYAIASLRSIIKVIQLNNDSKMTKWLKEHPYHFISKAADEWGFDEGNPIAALGGVIAVISWFASGIMLYVNFSVFAWPLLLGVAFYGLIAFSYWLNIKGFFNNWHAPAEATLISLQVNPASI